MVTYQTKTDQKQQNEKEMELELKKEIKQIAGWATDTVSINYVNKSKDQDIIRPHTIILFVPGNPGCVGWYTKPLLYPMIKKLGIGYAAYGISYAGHGIGDNTHVEKLHKNDIYPKSFINSKQRILHTIQGQIEHKIQWIDSILYQYDNNTNNKQQDQQSSYPNIIFLTHSIGAYLVQCLLLQRRDILIQTRKIIHFMPFFRFKPDNYIKEQLPLDTVAKLNKRSVDLLAFISYLISFIPKDILMFGIHRLLNIYENDAKEVTYNIIRQPEFARNFLSLGINEILLVPKELDITALNIIGKQCPTILLYCSNDKWSPINHMLDVIKLQNSNVIIPNSIYFEYMQDLQHDFIIYPSMANKVLMFVIKCIEDYSNYNDRFHYDFSSSSSISGIDDRNSNKFTQSKL